MMDFHNVPIGFGMALAQNTAAMAKHQKQAILCKRTMSSANGKCVPWQQALPAEQRNNAGRGLLPPFFCVKIKKNSSTCTKLTVERGKLRVG